MKITNIIIKSSIILFWIILIVIALYLKNSYKSSSNTLNVFGWAGMFDDQYIAKFERDTGIHVNISYYETNEELLVKLKATKGRGYDIIFPSDYMVYLLKQENVLKKLDKSRLHFYNRLNPALLNHYYDVNNDYSIPYEWSVYGIGYNKDFISKYFDGHDYNWGLIFDANLMSKYDYRVAMINDGLTAVSFASYYLYKTDKNITIDKLKEIKKVLRSQHKFVVSYTDFRADYLLDTKEASAAAISSSYILRSMQKYKNIGFFIPKGGSQVTVENMAIPIDSEKEDLIYKFVNFLYTKENLINNFHKLVFFPPTLDAAKSVKAESKFPKIINSLLDINKEEFKKFDFFEIDNFKDPITEQMIQDMWIQVKSW